MLLLKPPAASRSGSQNVTAASAAPTVQDGGDMKDDATYESPDARSHDNRWHGARPSRRTFLTSMGIVTAAATGAILQRPSASTGTTASTSTQIKLTHAGLTPFSAGNRDNWSPALDHLAQRYYWSDLEPSPGAYDFRAIDAMLNSLPEKVQLRLHLVGGDNAPRWLEDVSGPFVAVKNATNGSTVDCGQYWQPGYKKRWAMLCQALGKRYDANPRISGVSNGGCSLLFDEPFILGSDPASVQRLHDAGLSRATCQSALMDAMAALTTAFPTTVCEFACHDRWQYPDNNGQLVRDWPGERDLLNQLYSLYHGHIIFTDYGLGPNDYTPAQDRQSATDLYGWMHQLADEGGAIAWQLTVRTPYTTQTVYDSIEAGVRMGARWVEHAGFTILSNTQVQSLDTRLKGNL